MGATSTTEETKSEELVDNLEQDEAAVEQKKLAALKAKSKVKQEENKMSAKIVGKKERALSLGIIGTGQCGSRIAESFSQLGYDAVVCNTALQDLKFLNLPDSNKLLLDYSVGGAAKELEIGRAATEKYRGEILQLINNKLSNSQINVLCTSLGGGSGAGSTEVLIDILSEVGKPTICICVLPMSSEDPQTKNNSLETLSRLATLTQQKKIANLIIVDNAKIESIYSSVDQLSFYGVANKAIVEPLDAFNTLSAMPSPTKALDPMELLKLWVDSEGISTYGEFSVKDYENDVAIAEAVINNLASNLLAEGLDLKQSKYVGFMVVASKKVWEKIPASSINYASSMINDLCGNPKNIFKGMYVVDSNEDVVKVYSMFAGLGLPEARINQLKTETQELQSKVKVKDDTRNLSLQLNTGTSESVSAAQKVRDKIAQKSSTFGKFVSGTVDRRK